MIIQSNIEFKKTSVKVENTKCDTDLDSVNKTILFESLLTSFEAIFIFEATEEVVKTLPSLPSLTNIRTGKYPNN